MGKFDAIVAPFIASYVLRSAARPTALLECRDCAFRFYAERYGDVELEKLYGQYRGLEYFRARNKSEPWYTATINASIGGSEEKIAFRRGYVADMLSSELADAAPVDALLDFGGDRGQFIPMDVAKSKYVYEMSDVEPIAGVNRISSDSDLKARTYDVVMLCHVLEHSSDPLVTLRELRVLLRSESSVLLVEVPYERYDLHSARHRPWYRSWLGALTRLRAPLIAFDFYSTVVRYRWNRVPPFGFVKMHEHINFFEMKSLSALLTRAGFTVSRSKLIPRKSGALDFEGALLCVARPSQPT